MEELMQDKNNNGIPDQFEYQETADLVDFKPQGNAFDYAYDNEAQIAESIPDYKNYQWYKEPNEGYFYSLGQKLENKIESGEITPDELPEGSDIQKEAEQLYDNNPNNDEVNNEVIDKADFDNMSIDEIESRDAETITEDKSYLKVANDLGLDEEDLYYFEQPEFIENIPDDIKEEIKNEPDKDKKIEWLKLFDTVQNEPINTELPERTIENEPINTEISNESTKNEPINEPIKSGVKPGSFIPDSISGSGVSIPSISSEDRESETNDNATSSIKTDNKEQDNNAGSVNGTSVNNEHIDDTFDNLKFDEGEENIKSDGQAKLDVDGDAVHTSKNEGIDIKDLIKNSAGKNTLPFKFFFDGDDIVVAEIGTGRKLPLEEFIKVEPNSANRIIEVLNESV